jgi:glycosyltransferase involved in cell wall biosynthesis
MGKYTSEMLAAICKTKSDYWTDFKLVLSSEMSIDNDVFETIRTNMPNAKLDVLKLLKNEAYNNEVTKNNRKVISEYINGLKGFETIDFIIASLMQSEIAPAFPVQEGVHKILLVYDLIPLMLHEVYLHDRISQQRYLSKLEELFVADTYMSISKSAANELSLYLGIDVNRIHSIDGGAVNHASSVVEYEVDTPFILMPTGNDMRKNNERAIRAFEKFNKKLVKKYNLVITSFFRPHEVAEFSKLSDNITFTGNISGEELKYLYDKCEAILFPSEYEGLGMPIIEAIEHNKPIICSDIPVFREISEHAFRMFDPFSVDSIKEALEDVLLAGDARKVSTKEKERILEKYSWESTASKVIEICRGYSEKPSPKQNTVIGSPQIILSSPKNTTSGMFVQMLHGELSRHTKPLYFTKSTEIVDNKIRQNYLKYIAPVRRIEAIDDDNSFGVTLHFLSNDSDPSCLLAALAIPGILVLLDFDLAKLWDSAVSMGYMSVSRLDSEVKLGSRCGLWDKSYLLSLLSLHNIVVVHSKQKKDLLTEVVERMNLNTDVVFIAPPSVGVRYREVLPKTRSGTAITAADNLAIFGSIKPPETKGLDINIIYENSSDYQRIHTIESSSNCIVCLGGDDSYINSMVLLSTNLNTTPIGLNSGNTYSGDIDVSTIKTVNTKKQLSKLLSGISKVEPKTPKNIEYTNTFASYANSILELLSQNPEAKMPRGGEDE